MRYVDLHCDTLTEALKSGQSVTDGGLQASAEKLKKSGCAAQCFAIFTQGENAAAFFEESLNYYRSMLDLSANSLAEAKTAADFDSCLNGAKTGAVLTVESLGFLHGETDKLPALKARGVKMASLVWNYKNELAYPNLIFKNGLPDFKRREVRGLTPKGREAVEILDSLGIIIDISHLSDGGAEEILKNRKAPAVASHSNAAEVFDVSRNLTDGQIRLLADCGGVVGVNFCKDFLGMGTTARDTLEEASLHIKHIIKVGGEDVIALGSDFDGIPAPAGLEDCTKIQSLFEFLLNNGISSAVLEKISYKNAARVLFA